VIPLIKEQDLLEAIAECQGERNPNANTCIKLAAYYTILENITEQPKADVPQAQYSFASKPNGVGRIGDSDFLMKIEGHDAKEVLLVMDELMTTLQVINPRLYNSVMRKIAE